MERSYEINWSNKTINQSIQFVKVSWHIESAAANLEIQK